MNTTIFKGLIMALVGFIATTVTQTPINWIYVGIASLAFTLMYLGKNYILPSTSVFLGVNIRDLLSGLLVAISMAVSTFAASILTEPSVDWKALLLAVGSATGGYLLKTFFSNTNGQLLTVEH